MSEAIKLILVDDEAAALELVAQKLAQHFPDLQIMGSYQKPEAAVAAIKKDPPHILLVDVEMPRMNGFELLAQVEPLDFQVVFVTAYNQYALDALKRSAVDYVLKPIDDEDFIQAMEKAIAAHRSEQDAGAQGHLIELLQQTLSSSRKLIVPTTKGLSFIPQEEILHLEGEEGYTRIHLVDGSNVLSSYSLGKFQPMLAEAFFKCHKSHIVNIGKVRSFENEGYLVLDGGNRVPISRANKKVFLDLFN